MFIFEAMVIVRLTEEYLPHFMFLMDEIKKSTWDLKIGALEDECTDRGIKTSWSSLKRAFTLRQILEEGLRPNQTFYIPKKETLDALTQYCYGGNFIFRDLVQNAHDIDVDPKEVLQHYDSNRPKPETVRALFGEKPEKIEHYREQLDACKLFLEELNTRSWKQFINEEIDLRFNSLRKEMNDELKLKSELILFLEERVQKLERQHKRSNFIYRFFGSFGLFFLSVDYDEIDKTKLLQDFLDEYDGLIDDETVDELL